MSKPLQIFLAALLISAPMWWGINTFENRLETFVYTKINNKNKQIFTAEIAGPMIAKAQQEEQKQLEDLNIPAKAAFSVLVDGQTNDWNVIYKQSEKERLPIASLTKLMTALVVVENYDLTKTTTITQAAVDQEESAGQLQVGETLTFDNLLHIALIESSNDAAYALAETIGVDSFVEVMNWTAKNIGMRNTHFANPTGLDNIENYSTAQDLGILTKALLDKPVIWNILQKSEYRLVSESGELHHVLKNTNLLLTEDTKWKDKIYGGKTGYTLQANGCLVLVINDNGKYLINIILGADDRFGAMKNLIDNEL